MLDRRRFARELREQPLRRKSTAGWAVGASAGIGSTVRLAELPRPAQLSL